MSPAATQTCLLEELDARQNDVLSQLDALIAQSESVLNEWLARREIDSPDG